MSSLKAQVDQSVRNAALVAIESGSHRRYVGEESDALQHALSQLLGGAQVLLANSGSSALELSLRSIGVNPGDEVILSAYDYPGNFWVTERLGCTPVLVDVVSKSIEVNIDALEAARTEKTKACIVSHLHGQLQRVDQFRKWADEQSIYLIEDACQAFGARIQGKATTSFGHLGILSFGGSKVVSAGRGGALIANDERLFQRAKVASGAGSGAYALSELSAAIVRAQLDYLDRINVQCCGFFAEVEQQLPQDLPRVFLGEVGSTETAYYQAGWILDSAAAVEAATKRLCEIGISAGSGFPGFHRRSARRCRTVGALTNTAELVDRLLVVHHSIAIDERFSPQQLSAWIADGIGS